MDPWEHHTLVEETDNLSFKVKFCFRSKYDIILVPSISKLPKTLMIYIAGSFKKKSKYYNKLRPICW